MNTTKLTNVFVIGACAVIISNQALIPLGKSIINRTTVYVNNKEAERKRMEREKRLEARGPICKKMLQERINQIQRKGSGDFISREIMEYEMGFVDVQYQRCIDHDEDF